MAVLVVFDLDGVLIDSRAANYEAFARGVEALGLPTPEEAAVVDLIGLSAAEMLQRLGCPAERVGEIYEGFVKPHYLENLPRLARAVEGAAEVLTQLRQRGHRVVACTSGDRALQEKALRHIGLRDFFEDMQTPDDSRFHKPQVEYLRELVQRVGHEGPIVHVEDSQVGLQMGLECGVTTVFADYGFGKPEPLEPHFRIQKLSDLLEVEHVL
ncbi:MAG: HAD family hydrolase [Candidatus Eremiobacteraeota bacterium]|nr:HAD family hydrolase [Candidatus Eremiobacteraeota bacterium]MCW5868370.1 HAD family hydrolase [Candidatus Eremiobacteraeota bacterium]